MKLEAGGSTWWGSQAVSKYTGLDVGLGEESRSVTLYTDLGEGIECIMAGRPPRERAEESSRRGADAPSKDAKSSRAK